MAGQIKGYLTKAKLVEDDDFVTTTDVDVNKRAMDVAVKEGDVNVSGNVTATPSGLSTAGKLTDVTLNTATWTALPASALTDRNGMAVQNRTADQILIGFIAGAATSLGWLVDLNGEFFVDVTDAVVVYGLALSGTPEVTVMEVS